MKVMKNCRGVFSDKRGISVVVGYILLVSIVIIMSVIVYQWISTYIPREDIECADGVSLFVQDYTLDCTDGSESLDLTIKNSGRFDVAGYFIHATTDSSQELAVTDLSGATDLRGSGGSVNYPPDGDDLNSVSAGQIFSDLFVLTSIGQIYSIEIVPLRYELVNNRNRAVSCTNARIRETLSCFVPSSCGNNVKDGTDLCDGNPPTGDWGAVTGCGDLGYTGGTLSCYAPGTPNECTFDTSGCTGSTCNDIWEGPSENPGVVCDGGANCILQGQPNQCTCQAGFSPVGDGSCIGAPDLTISEAGTRNDDFSGSGQNLNHVSIELLITNQGTVATEMGTVSWSIDPAGPATPSNPTGGPYPNAINPSTSIIPNPIISWDYTVAGTYNPVAKVDPPTETNGIVTESIESNNQINLGTIICTQVNPNKLICAYQ
ncbi:MAG TPA: hypothetical protein VJ208_00550 [Candidatus Nanoarchaeia archaeon]|nr:hypothetical protein [Candidatus Nanoarchaeia archaeon]